MIIVALAHPAYDTIVYNSNLFVLHILADAQVDQVKHRTQQLHSSLNFALFTTWRRALMR